MFNDLNNLANLIEATNLNTTFTRSACDALRTTADNIAKSLARMTTTTADTTTADTTTADSTEAVKIFNVRYCEPRPAEFANLDVSDRVFICGVVDDLRYDVRVMTKAGNSSEIDLCYIHVEGFTSAFRFMDEFDAITHFEISGDFDSGEAWVKYPEFTVVLKWGGDSDEG